MEKTVHKSPHDTLIDALEKVENMGKVVVLWVSPDGVRAGVLDSDLTVEQALYMVELYKHWLIDSCLRKD